MSGRRILSDDQLDELGELREQGKSLGQLAIVAKARWDIDVHPNTLSWQMLRIGADLPPEKRKPTAPPRVMVAQRGNHSVRRFSPEEDRRLIELEGKGLNPSAIGRELGRKQNSVRGRLMTLARHDARQEEGL
jgi:hypothetical protein